MQDHGTTATMSTAVANTQQKEATLALELRIRLLETLVGINTAFANRPNARDASIARRGQAVVAGVYDALDRSGTEAIKRFLETYDLNKALLVPQLPSAGTASHLSAQGKAALILDSESDLRNLERELREIATLEKRGVASAGKLQDHESMKPRLKDLQHNVNGLVGSYSGLESTIDSLLVQYDDYVNTVSQIFVNWNDAISYAEKTVSQLEKEREL